MTALTSDLLATGDELAGAAKFACDHPGPFEIDAVLAAADDWDRAVSRLGLRKRDVVLVPVTKQLIAASDGKWKNVDVRLQSDGQMFFRVPDGRDTST